MSELLNRIDLRFELVKQQLANNIITDAGCWEFQGYLDDHGYGRIRIYAANLLPKKRHYKAHRVSYAFYNGVDPGALFVCHDCDNPKCINPDHLFLGTALVNTTDMHTKGRAAPQDGENNAHAKVTKPVVLQIVAKIKEGLSNKAIAELVPVSHSAISLIRLGKTWTNVLQEIGYNPEEYRTFKRKAA